MTLIIHKPTGAKLVLKKDGVTTGLLDAYGGAAAAYSLRRLSANYGEAVVRVRRSSDNTEQDFTAAQVTNGTLTTFCGAGDGFVRTWYDQSGNGRNAVQATTSSQPEIVNAGSLVLTGVKPSISFSNNFLVNTCPQVTVHTLIVSALTTTKSLSIITGTDSNVAFGTTFGYVSNTEFRMQSEDNANVFSTSVNFERLFFAFNDSSTSTIYANSSLKASGAMVNKTFDYNVIGGRQSQNPLYFSGNIQEIILYSSDQSANRTAIESNINAHYAIY